ncbi:proton-coupled zinc antiporter SLC30A1-like [Salvelinus fontinalis]|uniref:proton-coupled zinc antiporter SLC30A1-like n=1 Tax=Salvelinus fontinalis TaxID=8038 RepID=UPI0024864A80|nr:proton-coupled zinc antiporter SLC30A1-like [Salvelinus fontinalis]
MAWERNRLRLLCMLSITFAFFIVEVVVSRMTASLSMLSYSFHMLPGVIALVVALIAVHFSEKTQATSQNTFGWIRAEVMGALVNAVFLTAMCFTISIEAVERFTVPHEIESPRMVIGVGAAGLLVNMLGLLLFHEHAGHGHSHGGSHGINKLHKSERVGRESFEDETSRHIMLNCNLKTGDLRAGPGGDHEIPDKDNLVVHMKDITLEDWNESHHDSASQLNMQGVFLHVLGDALGSVIVVVNALTFTYVWQPCHAGETCVNPCYNSHDYTDHQQQHVNVTLITMLGSSTQTTVHLAGPCWVLYLDPILCIIMVGFLLYTTFPLLKESVLILLQTVPKQIDMPQLLGRLKGLDGVLAVHDLHIWQLAGSRIIATAHIKCLDPASYMDVAMRIKGLFHDEGIHATTVQPEFVTVNFESNIDVCELSCGTQCAPKLSCGTQCAPKLSCGTQCAPKLSCGTQCAPKLSCGTQCAPKLWKL